MNQEYYTPEKIEAYLTDNLSSSEKAAFERGLEKDPLLKNEVSLQKDILTSIGEVRKAQLKARLNAIDVNSTSGWPAVTWIAAASVSALIATGVYFYSTKETEQKATENQITTIETAPKAEITQGNKTEEPTQINTPVENQDLNTTVEKSAERKVTRKTKDETINTVVPNVPKLENNFTDQDIKNNDTEAPEKGLVEKTEASDQIVKTEIISKKNRAYSFYNKKLCLYGDFEKKPYSIKEIAGKNLIFMSYEGNYYELKPTGTEPQSLKPVTDLQTIKNLDTVFKK